MLSDPVSEQSQSSSSRSVTIPNVSNDEFTVRVLTLNCWGLWLGAKKRRQRMAGIVRYLREVNCDIVFLQEIWVSSDFEIIRDGLKDVYCFSHLYRSGSVLGSSGIVILCKWFPKVIHFEPYSLNGSPFYPWHGDWFAGKGIAYSRVDFDDLSLHLFSTHTHAYYRETEPVHDQYSVHRVCQSYQLAKFISFIGDTACNRKPSGRDLFIVAGDMNSTSSELPYKVLTTLAGLTDCFKSSRRNNSGLNILHKHKLTSYKSFVDAGSNSSMNSQGEKVSLYPTKDGDSYLLETLDDRVLFDSDTDDDDITYCHPKNSFTTGVSDKQKSSSRRRIDFILCRLLTHGQCVVDRIVTESEDPHLDCSLSDHEPVLVELKIIDDSHDQESHCRPVASSVETSFYECNIQVMKSIKDILMQYYQNNKTSKRQLFYVILFMFIVTLASTTYLANELIPPSTIIFMWMAASFLFTSGLLIGYLNFRFEQGAIEAILNDIQCKITCYDYQNCR